MDEKITAEQIRIRLEQLFHDAGYTAPELLTYIGMLEQENVKMNQLIRKLKLEAVRKTSLSQGMNSRLKDALRE